MFKTSLAGLLASALMLTAFASWAQSESQQVRERIVEQVLKPCEGKKAGDKVVMVDAGAVNMKRFVRWRRCHYRNR